MSRNEEKIVSGRPELIVLFFQQLKNACSPQPKEFKVWMGDVICYCYQFPTKPILIFRYFKNVYYSRTGLQIKFNGYLNFKGQRKRTKLNELFKRFLNIPRRNWFDNYWMGFTWKISVNKIIRKRCTSRSSYMWCEGMRKSALRKVWTYLVIKRRMNSVIWLEIDWLMRWQLIEKHESRRDATQTLVK